MLLPALFVKMNARRRTKICEYVQYQIRTGNLTKRNVFRFIFLWILWNLRKHVLIIITYSNSHHFYNFHFCLDTKMVQEHLQVLLHLDGVVFQLRHGEDSHLAVLPGPVLLQQEREQHQQAAVVDDPPHVDVSHHLKTNISIIIFIYLIY